MYRPLTHPFSYLFLSSSIPLYKFFDEVSGPFFTTVQTDPTTDTPPSLSSTGLNDYIAYTHILSLSTVTIKDPKTKHIVFLTITVIDSFFVSFPMGLFLSYYFTRSLQFYPENSNLCTSNKFCH